MWLSGRASGSAAMWPAEQEIAGYGCRENPDGPAAARVPAARLPAVHQELCSDAAQCFAQRLHFSESSCTSLELALLATQHIAGRWSWAYLLIR